MGGNTIIVTQYLCRVFTAPGNKEGGNPLTIFLFHESIHNVKKKLADSVETAEGNLADTHLNEKSVNSFPDVESFHSSLARSCDWESVIVYIDNKEGNNDSLELNNTLPEMMFFMPSGIEVSFCAHAAIGACMAIAMERRSDLSNLIYDKNGKILNNTDLFLSVLPSSVFPFDIQFTTSKGIHHHSASILNSKLVELKMSSPLKESNVLLLDKKKTSNSTENFDPYKIIKNILNEIGLCPEDVTQDDVITNTHKKSNGMAKVIPPFLNSSVARTKTLIPIISLDRLHAATNPRNKENFRSLCESVESTGIYLYSPLDQTGRDLNANQNCSNLYECRQFPSASGYPEDPATGIAAATLAASLYSRKETRNNIDQLRNDIVEEKYFFYQGTAMKKKSLIQIRFEQLRSDVSEMNYEENEIDLYCSGFVDIDGKSILNF